MERKLAYIFTFAILALLSVNAETVFAQESSQHFIASVSEYYSPNTNASTYEIGFGYQFPKVGLKINFSEVGLSEGNCVYGEYITINIPALSMHSFEMIPEVSAGILHGRFSTNEDQAIKGQIQIGVAINYNLSNSMSCGLQYKTLHYGHNTLSLIGWNYSLHF